MSVPARKKSSSSVRRRRSHHKVTTVNTSACEKCGEATKPHYACGSCGNYNGRSIKKGLDITPAPVKSSPKKEAKAKENKEETKKETKKAA